MDNLGIVLFILVISKAKDENYETLAEKMLLRVTNSIKQLPTVDIENGITGIGLFVMWLNKKAFNRKRTVVL